MGLLNHQYRLVSAACTEAWRWKIDLIFVFDCM